MKIIFHKINAVIAVNMDINLINVKIPNKISKIEMRKVSKIIKKAVN